MCQLLHIDLQTTRKSVCLLRCHAQDLLLLGISLFESLRQVCVQEFSLLETRLHSYHYILQLFS